MITIVDRLQRGSQPTKTILDGDKMFRTILAPLEGSPESNVALAVARAIARPAGGSIWLLRVARESALPDHHEPTHEAAFSLERIAAELAGGGLEVHPVTREGDAAQEILHLSNEISADVIVMRTHGKAGLERAVFGSVTEEVLKKSRLPLVLVRSGGRRVSSIRKLLVPVDGSPGGLVALRSALALARTTSATLAVVQVVVPIPMLSYAAPYDYAGAAFYDSTWDDDALAAAKTYVDAVSERARGFGVSATGEARIAPDVGDAIVDAADKSRTDLIVMSTHALTGPARAVLGSVADAVVRSARCPVLLVKRPDARGSGDGEATGAEIRDGGPDAR